MTKPPNKDPIQAELATHRRAIEDLSRQLRQVPSRFPHQRSSETATIRVRFHFTASDGDLSEGETVDSGEPCWVDGLHALQTLHPTRFGDTAEYHAILVGTASRSSTTRPLFRLVSPTAVHEANAAQIETAAEVSATVGIVKVLTEASAAITTTIDGVAQENRILHLRESWQTTTGWRWDWAHGRYSGALAVPDIGVRRGSVLSLGMRGGGRAGISSNLDPANPANSVSVSIDPGEPFRLDLLAYSDKDFNTIVSPQRLGHTIGSYLVTRTSLGYFRVQSLSANYGHFDSDSAGSSRHYAELTAADTASGSGLSGSSTAAVFDAAIDAMTGVLVTISWSVNSTGRIATVAWSTSGFTAIGSAENVIGLLVTGGRAPS